MVREPSEMVPNDELANFSGIRIAEAELRLDLPHAIVAGTW